LSGPLTLTYLALGPVSIESFMYLLYDERELVERLLDVFLDYHLRLLAAIRELPYHFHYIGDDLCSTTGPLISPNEIEGLWAPRMGRLVEAALSTDRPVIIHCCGMQAPILPYVVKWGVNAVHPLQPGANDIYAVKREYGDRLTLIGNMDIAGVLLNGTPEQVRADTREHIERLAGDGGYVVCSSHSIIDSVPVENYLAMVGAAVEFGRY
jgi:uroporphyrinogen-III decarboxylase